METLVVELTHKNALQLLKDLEAMDIIRLHSDEEVPKKSCLTNTEEFFQKKQARILSIT